jgi:hypothetical protein
LREFDQQVGLLFGPFAGFCRLHCCPRTRIETCINCDGDSGTMKADALHPLRLAAGRRFRGAAGPLAMLRKFAGNCSRADLRQASIGNVRVHIGLGPRLRRRHDGRHQDRCSAS